MNPVTGERQLLSYTGLDRTHNFSFEIDKVNGIAYRTGLGAADEFLISVMNLNTATFTTIPSSISTLGVYEIPEPGSGVLSLCGTLLALLQRRRREL